MKTLGKFDYAIVSNASLSPFFSAWVNENVVDVELICDNTTDDFCAAIPSFSFIAVLFSYTVYIVFCAVVAQDFFEYVWNMLVFIVCTLKRVSDAN